MSDDGMTTPISDTELLSAFERNDDGSWTSVAAISLKYDGAMLAIGPGAVFRPGDWPIDFTEALERARSRLADQSGDRFTWP